jgi:hypothetical protein
MKQYLTKAQFNRKYGLKLTEVVGHITEIDRFSVYADLLVVYSKYGKEREQEYCVKIPLRKFRGCKPCIGRIFKIDDGKVVMNSCKPHVRRIIYNRAKNRTADLVFED